LAQRDWSAKDFALATNTRYVGPWMWSHAPGRSRLHRISVILEDPALHDLATNDIYWDKLVDIVSLGNREVFSIADAEGDPVVTQGVVVRYPTD
jgi:replicative DNA helicase